MTAPFLLSQLCPAHLRPERLKANVLIIGNDGRDHLLEDKVMTESRLDEETLKLHARLSTQTRFLPTS